MPLLKAEESMCDQFLFKHKPTLKPLEVSKVKIIRER